MDYFYDPTDHMANDPVDFYTHGYGGFGYDTSHVNKPAKKHSELYCAAKDGDLAKVQRLVMEQHQHQQKDAHDDKKKKKKPKQFTHFLNHARHWTEVDYKMSGFTKEYDWFDRTPLLIAIEQGHAEVVQYLLEQGADPTLKACPSEDVHVNALQEAETAVTRAKQHCTKVIKAHDDKSLRSFQIERLLPKDGLSDHDYAWNLLDAEPKAVYIQKMVHTALEFFEPNKNAHSSYNNNSSSSQRTYQLPKDMKGIKEALQALGPCPKHNRSSDESSSDDFQKVLQALQELKRRPEAQKVLEKARLQSIKRANHEAREEQRLARKKAAAERKQQRQSIKRANAEAREEQRLARKKATVEPKQQQQQQHQNGTSISGVHCPIRGCNKWFKTSDDLQAHIKAVSGAAHRRYRREHDQGSAARC